jgi:hypothetical protein
MRKFAPKAVFSILAIKRIGAGRTQWDRIALVFATAVTLGLAALYVYGKATSRW